MIWKPLWMDQKTRAGGQLDFAKACIELGADFRFLSKHFYSGRFVFTPGFAWFWCFQNLAGGTYLEVESWTKGRKSSQTVETAADN
ncbi:unnamed protein product, partial [Linum tenue]